MIRFNLFSRDTESICEELLDELNNDIESEYPETKESDMADPTTDVGVEVSDLVERVNVGVQTCTSMSNFQKNDEKIDKSLHVGEQDVHSTELAIIDTPKVLISVDLLENLFKGICGVNGCLLVKDVKVNISGSSAVVSYGCKNGHNKSFCTSHRVNGLLANNLQLAAGML